MKLPVLQLCAAAFACCVEAINVGVCSSTAVSEPGTVRLWIATHRDADAGGGVVIDTDGIDPGNLYPYDKRDKRDKIVFTDRVILRATSGTPAEVYFTQRYELDTPVSSAGLTVSDLADTIAANSPSNAYPADSTLTCYDAGSVELYAVGRTGSETPHTCLTEQREVATITAWYSVAVTLPVSGVYEVYTRVLDFVSIEEDLKAGFGDDLHDPCSMSQSRRFFLPLNVAVGSAMCTTQPDVPAHVVPDSLLQCNGAVHNITAGTLCNVQCEDGYLPVGDLVCEEDPMDSTSADWSTSFSCVAQTCALPDYRLSNNDDISGQVYGLLPPCTRFTAVGTECEFSCLASSLVGRGSIVCDSMGNWQEGSNYGSCLAPTPAPRTQAPPPPTNPPATPASDTSMPTPAPTSPPTSPPTTSPTYAPSYSPTAVPATNAPPTPTNPPETSAPDTAAPPTNAPPTNPPTTPAPHTPAPETSAPTSPPTSSPTIVPTPVPDTPAPTQCTAPDTAPLTCEATASRECAWRVVQSGRLLAVGFSADGSRVATGSDDGVRVYDSTTGVQVAKLACADFASYDVTFSSDGARVAVGGAGGRVVVCDAVTGALVTLMDMRAVGSVPVRRVRFTPDARFLVASGGGSDVYTRVYNMASPVEQEIVIHKHAREVAFSADGALLATSWGTEVDEVVTVWRVQNGAKVAELPSQFARVTGLSFSASGDELLRGMDDGTVRVSTWDGGAVGEGAVTERLVLETQTKTVFDARHSPNGALLAAVGEGEATVWHAAGSVAHQLYGHTRAGLPRLAFSPDSTRLATASHDGTLLLWNL